MGGYALQLPTRPLSLGVLAGGRHVSRGLRSLQWAPMPSLEEGGIPWGTSTHLQDMHLVLQPEVGLQAPTDHTLTCHQGGLGSVTPKTPTHHTLT